MGGKIAARPTLNNPPPCTPSLLRSPSANAAQWVHPTPQKKHLQQVPPAQPHTNPQNPFVSLPGPFLGSNKDTWREREGDEKKDLPSPKAGTHRDYLPDQPRGASSSSLSSAGVEVHRLPCLVSWEKPPNNTCGEQPAAGLGPSAALCSV